VLAASSKHLVALRGPEAATQIGELSAATVLNRVAKLHHCPAVLEDSRLHVLLEKVAANVPVARPQSLASTAWSIAKLQVKDAPLLTSIAAAALAKLSEFGTQEMSNTAWSFAKLSLCHVPFLDAIAAESRALIWAARTQELSNTAWALATQVL